MESFFQNILQCDREKHLFVNFHTDICSIYNYSFGVFFSKYQLELIYVFSEILFKFICSIEQLVFLLMKVEIKEINKKFS